jgi:hypothetical protein
MRVDGWLYGANGTYCGMIVGNDGWIVAGCSSMARYRVVVSLAEDTSNAVK